MQSSRQINMWKTDVEALSWSITGAVRRQDYEHALPAKDSIFAYRATGE